MRSTDEPDKIEVLVLALGEINRVEQEELDRIKARYENIAEQARRESR